MAHFIYLAQDSHNNQIKADLEAKDISEAKAKLRGMDLYIIWIKPENRILEKFSLGRVKNLDLAIFSHQFSVMISSGIPLIRALNALADETTNKKFRAIINKIKSDVDGGVSLSNALLKHPKVFSNFFISLIKTGEVAGILPAVLNKLAIYLEKQEDLRRKVRSSFAYPVIVTFVAIAVVIFLLIFIVPVFRSVYKTMKITLPVPTLVLIALSDIVKKFWWLLILSAGLLYYGLMRLGQKKTVGLKIDQFKLKLPLFGPLNQKVAVSRFVRTLSTLIASGIPLSQSLNIVREIVDNKLIANTIELVQKDINQGKALAEALKAQHIFPPLVVQMIAAGEESGKLEMLLDKCADFLDEDIDALIKSLVVKLEPTLTFFLAILVGFIALAIYLPMFDLIKQISR